MLRKEIEENYPFISVITYGGKEYVGIVVNQDANVTTILNYENIKTIGEKREFLRLGEIWWMESNRTIPITIFLKNDIQFLKYCMMCLSSKDVDIILGPTMDLNAMHTKKAKRKNVQLVRQQRK